MEKLIWIGAGNIQDEIIRGEINKELCEIIIDQLNSWRDCFLDGSNWSFEKSLGIVEVTDYLENIDKDEHRCYASFLFKQLSDCDKEYILRKLDFYVDFDGLYSIYDL